jgi:hypothetical protein
MSRPRRVTQADIDQARLDRLSALAGEHFADYLVLVRVGDGVIWRRSDDTWALGAAKRFDACKDEDDRERRRDLHAGTEE